MSLAGKVLREDMGAGLKAALPVGVAVPRHVCKVASFGAEGKKTLA